MTDISPELQARMIALIRDLHADHMKYDLHDRQQDFCARTAAIVALLPVEVDADLVAARELLAARYDRELCPESYVATTRAILAGEDDGTLSVQYVLAAIKRGRELEREASK